MEVSVKTDYSQLTPYNAPEELFTRLSPGFMPELVPSKDYGPLLPYVGALLDAGPAYPVGTDEGLVTLDGKIVLDAVCYEIVKPAYYDESVLTYPDDTVYILKKAIEKDIDGHTYGVPRYAVCARDGSWATPFKYTYVICCDRAMLLFNDLKTNDFDAMDYGGRILYNSKELDCYAQLRYYYLHKGDGPSPMDIGGGTVALWDYDAKNPCVFLDETSGALVNAEFPSIRAFSEGLAAVVKDGLWGYVDNRFSFVIPPQFTYGGKFHEGKAIVCLSDNEFAVIDTHGKILLRSAIRIRQDHGFFVTGGNEAFPACVYDQNLNELFKAADAEARSTFDTGFASVKNGVTTVLSGGTVFALPGEYQVIWLDGGYVFCGTGNKDEFRLMTTGGAPIAAFDKAYSSGSVLRTPDGQAYISLNDSKSNDYIVLDGQGRTIAAGAGTATAGEGYSAFSD